MSIKQCALPVRFVSESPTGKGPAVLEVAGVDIASCARSIAIRSSVDTLATVDIEILPLNGFDISLPASVTSLYTEAR